MTVRGFLLGIHYMFKYFNVFKKTICYLINIKQLYYLQTTIFDIIIYKCMIKILRSFLLGHLILTAGLSNAQTWNPVTPQPTIQVIWDVHALNATSAWAVGNSGTILQWNGTAWAASTISGVTSQRFAVWAIDANNVYVGGVTTNNQLHRFNGTSWENLLTPTNWFGGGSIRSIWGTAANNVWIAGSSGRIFHWNGTSWTARNTGISSSFSPARIWGTDAANMWAVGSVGGDNTGVIYKWNGTSAWVEQLSAVPTIRGVWGSSATNMWAVGGTGGANPGQIYRLSGSTWTVQTATTNTLNHIYGSNGSNIWAVGNSGAIHYYNGTSWVTQASGRGVNDHLYAAAVGKTGTNNRLILVGEGNGTVNPLLTATMSISTLPLTWKSFSYQYNGKDVLLNWATTSETNTDRFELEHKYEEGNWSPLSVTPAAGNSITETAYSYNHENPASGKHYYRIRQVDIDGNSSYSKTLYVLAGKGQQGVRIGTNPVKNKQLQLDSDANELISIVDLQGRELLKRNITAGRTLIDVSALTAGTYVLISSTGTLKFIL